MTSSHQAKLFIENSTTISHDTLHVLGGVLVWLVVALILRRPLSSWLPWLWLLAVIGWNEAADLWVEQWPDVAMQYGDGAKDFVLTLFAPTLIMLALRLRPQLGREAPRPSRK